jgi:hypothetical protein
MKKYQKYLSLVLVLAVTLFGALALTACESGGTGTAFNIVGNWEHESEPEIDEDDGFYVDSLYEYIEATSATTTKVVMTFSSDKTFTMARYVSKIYSGYDEEYEEYLDESDTEEFDEYYSRGTYTVDGEKINFVLTGDGEVGENGQIVWGSRLPSAYQEGTAYITLNKNIMAGLYLLKKK